MAFQSIPGSSNVAPWKNRPGSICRTPRLAWSREALPGPGGLAWTWTCENGEEFTKKYGQDMGKHGVLTCFNMF